MGRAFKIPDESLDGTIFDDANPDALINIVPTRMQAVLHRLKPKLPRVLASTESELRKIIKPDERDERIRLAFWDEYNHSTHLKKQMSIAAMLHGIMSWEAWVTVYERSDRKMLWILNPPSSYQASMRRILHIGTERLLEIMQAPIYDGKGRLDSKAVVSILKAFQLVDLRVKGAITQKVQIQQQSLNVHTSMQAAMPGDANVEHLSLEDLEKLERRISRARSDGRRLMDSLPAEERREFIEATAREEAVIGSQSGRPLEGLDLDSNEIIDVEEELEVE
jgi:hypothetical protein